MSLTEIGMVPYRNRDTGPSNQESLQEIEIETEFSRRSRTRRQGLFLKGPIPLSRIGQASKLGGQCLAVMLAIQHRADVTGDATVTLPKWLLDEFGIGKNTKSQALHALEKAGMIAVERQAGKTAKVTLREQA